MTDPMRFQIGHLKIVDHLILGFADLCNEKEKFLSEDVRVETVTCNSWDQICEKLALREINGAFLTIPEALNLFSKGLRLRLLMFTHRGGSLIIRKNNPKAMTIKDFKGKSVLIPSRLSVQHMLLHRLVTSTGTPLSTSPGNPAQIIAETAAPALMPDILEQDTDDDIAGFTAPEPFGTLSIQSGSGRRLCRTSDLWKNHPCSAFVLHQDAIDASPEAVFNLVSLLRHTGAFLETENIAGLCAAAGQFLGLPDAQVIDVLSNSAVCFSPDLLRPDAAAVQAIQDYMADIMGVLKRKSDLDHFICSQFFTEQKMDHSLED